MSSAARSPSSTRATEAYARLAHAFLVSHPSEAARSIGHHGAAEAVPLLRELAPREAALLLTHVEPGHAAAILLASGPETAAAIVSNMAVDVAARLLRRLDESRRAPILDECERRTANALRRVLDQPADTAAGLMDAHGVTVPENLTASAALARARHARRWLGTYVYVVDDQQRLTGVVSLHELLTASPRASLTSLMARDVAHLPERADRAAIVSHPGWRYYHELPVIDGDGALLGVLHYATVRRLQQDLVPARPPESGFAPLLAIGELYWVGMARVLGSLLTAVGSTSQAPAREPR